VVSDELCCKRAFVGRLIYASSSSIYGNQTTVPFSEDSMTDTPVSLYAATKKSNELIAYSYSHLYKICVTGLRFFTVYGPYGRPDMAPYIFTEAIMNGKEVNVFNNGDLMRDFTYIDDIVEGIVRVVKQPSASPVAVYNIGCGKPVRLMDFLAAIEDAVGRKAEIRFQPMQKGDVYQTYADISAMERDYGFRPQTEMQEGVKRYVEWFREFYG